MIKCPECKQGKCVNCTIMMLDPNMLEGDRVIECECDHE